MPMGKIQKSFAVRVQGEYSVCLCMCVSLYPEQTTLCHVNSAGCNSIAKRRFHGSVTGVVAGLWFLPVYVVNQQEELTVIVH